MTVANLNHISTMDSVTRKAFIITLILIGAASLAACSAVHLPQTTTTVSVQTTSGLLNGIKHELGQQLKNNSIYKFLAVPYAQAPVGSLRFQRPVELSQQDEGRALDASHFGKTCPQFRHLTRFISPLLNVDQEHAISEDCLHLNVFVPASVGSVASGKLNLDKQLPVVVWIPGEGFDFADARQFDGSYLAHKTQSIVITVQYRVGVLGFLQAPKMGITGNMGLYDQLMALKWVKRNVAAFGGDSSRITLMGRFSGSMSISALITAPKQELIRTEDDGELLFSRVALLSGIAVSDWIINGKQAERVQQLEQSALAKDYCSEIEIKNMTCLQKLPYEQLLRISEFGWRLVVDNELIGSLSPIEAIKKNQFPSELEGVLIGETGQEGTLCLYRHMLQTYANNYAKLIEEDKLTTNDVYDIIRDDSLTYFGYNLTKSNPIQSALESMDGLQQQSEDVRLRDKYLDACSAFMIKSHSNRFKRSIMSRNDYADNRMDSSKRPVEVYHYELKYKPSFSLAPDYIKTAAHGDDIPLIFGLLFSQPRRTVDDADLLMTKKMMSYIGNFVHGNNPLLINQHQSLTATNNETSQNMDNDSDERDSGSLFRRSWSSEGQVYHIDLTKRDLLEISQSKNQTSPESAQLNQPQLTQESGVVLRSLESYQRPNLRVILVESPSQSQFDQAKVQSLIEYSNDDSPSREFETQQHHRLLTSTTRSQRLLELHKQQMLDESLLSQSSLKNMAISQQPATGSGQSPATAISFVNESSFLTMLVFSSCIIILALMALCIGLCLIIFRNNIPNNLNKGMISQQHRFTTSASSCNICEDSHAGSIDCAVLSGNRKDGRGFSNVFAKLRQHHSSNNTNHSSQPAITQPQCTSQQATGQRLGQTTTTASAALADSVDH